MDAHELFELAKSGSGEEMKAALKPIMAKHSSDGVLSTDFFEKCREEKLTLMQVACSLGNAACVQSLLELGASPMERTPKSNDFFDIACACGYGTDLGRETCLHLAAKSGNAAVVNLLLAAGLDINARSANDCTPLISSAERARRRMASKDSTPVHTEECASTVALIQAGADLNASCGEVHRSSLHRNITPHSMHMRRLRLRARVSSGLTALHWAANTGDYGVARSLVAAGADVNARTSEHSVCDREQTPLHFAVEFQDIAMVQLLLEAGADANAKDAFGITPLHQVFAVAEESYHWWRSSRNTIGSDFDDLKKSRMAIAEMLLRAGADVEAKFALKEHTAKNDAVDRGSILDLMSENKKSGREEVQELLLSVHAEPRSLISSCRLAVRKCLSRPIIRSGNVDDLRLPNTMKCYVAMDTL